MQTYSDLKAAIPTWIVRQGDARISSNIDDIISLAEQMFAYGFEHPQFQVDPLRVRGMETPAQIVISRPITGAVVGGAANAITLTPSSVVASYANGLLFQFSPTAPNTDVVTLNVSGAGAVAVKKGSARDALEANDLILGGTYNVYYDAITSVWVLLPELSHAPLPAGYMAMRSFYRLAAPDNMPLGYMTPDLMNSLYLSSEIGPPKKFTIEADALRFAPVPDATYFAPMVYFKKLTPLASAATGTNWLMKNAPGIYLAASCFRACMLRNDDQGALRWFQAYGAEAMGLQKQDMTDRHSGSALTIQNDTGCP